jgi:NDMA-dependent alcohol dehydrogenase
MKTLGAILWDSGTDWSVEEIEMDAPHAGEVTVQWRYAGLCHTEEHLVTGDLVPPADVVEQFGLPPAFPMLGGHEASGVVVDVGPEVHGLQPGDHVVSSFIPACGQCRWCSSGISYLCDLNAQMFVPGMTTDNTVRHRARGRDLLQFAKVGAFAGLGVLAESSLIKIDSSIPLELAALVSCGVATGFGSAVNRAKVAPGETVVVVGVGGIGINAVQGARIAGAASVVAVDPVELKRKAALDFGATHVAESIAEALGIVSEMTQGVMAERVILCPGVLDAEIPGAALPLVAKSGTLVVTAIAPMSANTVNLNMFELGMYNKEIKGSIFGSGNGRVEVPRLLTLYKTGQLKLEGLITSTYSLADINQGFADMRAGKNIRGVIDLDRDRSDSV